MNSHLVKPDDDGDSYVVRVILRSLFGEGSSKFIETFSRKDDSNREEINIHQDNWWCGTRIELEDNFAIQLCFDGGNMFWAFLKEILLPKIETIAGSITLVDANKPEIFRYWPGVSLILVPCIVCIYSTEPLEPSEVENISAVLNIPSEIPVVPCVITDSESVNQVLLVMLDETLKFIATGKMEEYLDTMRKAHGVT